MSDTTVYIAFDLSASGGNYFTLNDPVKGLLDSATYVLGGDILIDVTQYVSSVSINRGKSRELDKFSAGNATIVLNNDTRIFDPFYFSSPYAGQIVPRKQVVIQSNGISQFTGYIDDWDFNYELGGKSLATVSCADGFMQLASTELASFTTTSQSSGDRINAILNRSEVAWPSALRSIETGQQTLQADTVPSNTNALTYLQTVETSEPGLLFINKSGAVTFKDRINTAPTGDIIFADDGRANSVSYKDMQVIYGSELLHNRVVITRLGGTAQTAEVTSTQSVYGVQTLSQDGLLMSTDASALALAQYLVAKYAQPELRFASIGVTLHDKTPTEQSLILNLEINDIVQIVFTPNGIGDAINEYGQIIGISHSIGIDQHYVTFSFGSVENSVDYNATGVLYSQILLPYNGTFVDTY